MSCANCSCVIPISFLSVCTLFERCCSFFIIEGYGVECIVAMFVCQACFTLQYVPRYKYIESIFFY